MQCFLEKMSILFFPLVTLLAVEKNGLLHRPVDRTVQQAIFFHRNKRSNQKTLWTFFQKKHWEKQKVNLPELKHKEYIGKKKRKKRLIYT